MLKALLATIQKVIKDRKSNQKSNQKILDIINKNNKITIKEISKKTSMSKSGVKRIIRIMKEEGVLLRIGSDRNGCWQIKTKDK